MWLIRTFWSPPEREGGVSSERLTQSRQVGTLQNLIALLSQGFQNFGVLPKGRKKGEE